jgi:hypothetical protein
MSLRKLFSTGLLFIIAMAASAASTALEPRRMNMAQALSPRCSTPAGICFIEPPLPIGSPCVCGQFRGTIIW